MLAPIIVLCIVHPVCGFGDDSTPKVYIENYSAWRYFNLDSWPGNSWMMPWFDDTAWKTGGAYLATKQETRGQEISTTLPSSKSAYHTYYFRKTFIVEDVSQVTRMSLNVDYDDAYVVYINGQKVASSNFACDWHRHKAVCWPYPHHSLIDTNADAPSEPRFPQVDLSWEQMDYLVDGVNHIAVAVKQGVPESTDAAFMLTLYGYEKKRMFPSLLYLLLPAIISVFVLDVAYTWWKRARLKGQAAVAEAAEGGPEAPASVSGADVALPAIADNTVLLVSVKSKDHSSAVSGLLNLLVNQRGMGGVYLTITRPYAFVLSAMDKASIPSENVYFIDCVSQMAGQHKSGLERVVFIENPSSLEEVTMYLDRMLDKVAGDRKFLFLDSLSSLLIYNSDKSVREFAHFLINKVRLMGIASVVLSIEKKEAEDMVNTMVPMCDARVHWDDRMAYAGGSAEPAPGQETEPSPGQDYGVKDGHSYLLLEDEGKVGVEVFSQLYSLGGYSGLCITRDKPEDVEKVLGGAGVRILWLTDTVEASASVIHPNPIDISVLIKDFLKENRKSIILLDGIQYIIQNTNFKTVLAFLSRLKDLVADSDSILLVPVVKISLNDKELGLLESELDVLEP